MQGKGWKDTRNRTDKTRIKNKSYKVWKSPSFRLLRWRVKDALQHLSDYEEDGGD